MKLKLTRLLLSAMWLLSLLAPVAFVSVVNAACDPSAATATINACLNSGACLQVENKDCTLPDADKSVNNIIATVINILSLVIGVVAVIMIIIGGLKYITSSGDSANTSSAKNTILYAIIGLVIVALAQVIVRFVLSRDTPTPPAAAPTAPVEAPPGI